MKLEINSLEDLNKHISKLPTVVIADIDKRITDWLASGGKATDNYVKQQFRYAENFINMCGM